ncbi:6-carboxytetrahydropterin synthase [Aliidiomarina celeris]|uniref:6-carboxytetrahydropterin synthase n=1 Tax=Aliidiomarina celeris TaxID=2249428 RepID=UPI000DEABE88|nr:6-carboxytetrahydropterin synthase [Aliidiomarina celeris]
MLLFVNDLTVMDFSYLCPERGMVGESWIVDIELDGSLNDQSMVLDFGRVKKQLKRIIDESVDHKLLVPIENSITTVQANEDNQNYWVDFEAPAGSIHLYCPSDAFAFIDADTITKDSVMDYLRAVIKRELPTNVKAISLTLRDEAIPSFYYHYTHGLKKHDGNCQRIAHGHRSAIQIFVNGMRTPRLEQQWSKRWEDIYIGSAEDVVAHSALTKSAVGEKAIGNHHVAYSYVAEQGLFELAMPEHHNEVIPTDSTVECIADYIAQTIKQQEPDAAVKVIAFEGVGKGAIGYA